MLYFYSSNNYTGLWYTIKLADVICSLSVLVRDQGCYRCITWLKLLPDNKNKKINFSSNNEQRKVAKINGDEVTDLNYRKGQM